MYTKVILPYCLVKFLNIDEFYRRRYDLYQVGDYLLVKSFKRDFEVITYKIRMALPLK